MQWRRVEECSGCVALPTFFIFRRLILRGEALYRSLLLEVCIANVCTVYTVNKWRDN
jgi:hypothetical protein